MPWAAGHGCMNHILARVHVATFLANNGTHGTLLCSDWKRYQACAGCAVWYICVATTLSYDNRFVGLRMSSHVIARLHASKRTSIPHTGLFRPCGVIWPAEQLNGTCGYSFEGPNELVWQNSCVVWAVHSIVSAVLHQNMLTQLDPRARSRLPRCRIVMVSCSNAATITASDFPLC